MAGIGWIAAFGRNFDHRSLEEGRRYQRMGLVTIERITTSLIVAQVQGTRSYEVRLTWGHDGAHNLGSRCSCPRFEGGDQCKHIAALMVQLDADGHGLPRANALPPAVPVTAAWSQPLAVARAPAALAPALPREAPASPREAPPEWEFQVEMLGRQLRTPVSHGSPVRGTVWYALELMAGSKPRSQVGISVHLEAAETGRKATWSGVSKPVTVKLISGTTGYGELPDPVDRHLVAVLRELAVARSWAVALPRVQELPPSLALDLLARLAATGRLVMATGKTLVPGSPLTVDSEPWRPTLVVGMRPDGGVALAAAVRRGDDSRSLKEATILAEGRIAVFGDLIVGLVPQLPPEAVATLARLDGVVVPQPQVTALVSRLGKLPPGIDLEIPEAAMPREEVHPPQMRVTFGFDPWGFLTELDALYDRIAVGLSDPDPHIDDPANNRILVRDLEAERAAWTELLQGPGSMRWALAGGFSLHREQLDQLLDRAFQLGWLVEARGQKVVRRFAKVETSVNTRGEWFTVHLEGTFGDSSASTEEMLAGRHTGGLVDLADGSVGLLPDTWARQLAAMAALAHGERGGELHFASSQAMLLDALVANLEVRADEEFDAMRSKLAVSRAAPAPVDPPAGFAGELRPYQREGLGWLEHLVESGFGGCLADDMGLGKTVQVLAMLVRRHEPGLTRRGPSMVVAPKSVVHNWVAEAAKFAPGLRVLEYGGAGRKALLDQLDRVDVLVTTYQLARMDVESLRQIRFDVLVLDEAQMVKNRDTLGYAALRLLQVERRLALTGTPVENHLGELWSMLELLNPGLLGRLPKTKGFDLGREQLEILARAVRPFLLRRTKREVLKDLPERTEQTLTCTMAPAQRRVYDELRSQYRASLLDRVSRDGIAKSKVYVLEALLRLRQAACHPVLVDPKYAKVPSTKLDLLIEQLVELQAEEHKVLVFSQFTSLLSLVEKRLKVAGIPWTRLDGRTRNRAEKVAEFSNDPNITVFLISLKAGGTGLNLTAASYVFLLDPWWNPAVEAQAIDRAHRIGQQRPVIAYRLVVEGTVEEHILVLQEHKRQLADALLSADTSVVRSLTLEDLELLLG